MTNYTVMDDLSQVRTGDWIKGVGYISTSYEETFIRNFAKVMKKYGVKVKK